MPGRKWVRGDSRGPGASRAGTPGYVPLRFLVLGEYLSGPKHELGVAATVPSWWIDGAGNPEAPLGVSRRALARIPIRSFRISYQPTPPAPPPGATSAVATYRAGPRGGPAQSPTSGLTAANSSRAVHIQRGAQTWSSSASRDARSRR